MANTSIDDTLVNTFTSLNLRPAFPPVLSESSPQFHCFSDLPTELRLKILRHALPEPSRFDMVGKVLVSDPSFGLYISFEISSFVCAASPESRVSNTGHDATSIGSSDMLSLKGSTRMLALLAATKETREVYLNHFAIALPLGMKGIGGSSGILHISKYETLTWKNLDRLMEQDCFRRAIKNHYRLQDWWTQLQYLVTPIHCFIFSEDSQSAVHGLMQILCLKMTGLKNVKAIMWDGFDDIPNQIVKDMLSRAMRTKMALTEAILQKHKMDIDGNYKMPSIELVA